MRNGAIGLPLELEAEILLSASAVVVLPLGGYAGMQPSLYYGGYRAACRIHPTQGADRIELGAATLVTINLAYSTPAHDGLQPGERFVLSVGGREIGSGIIIGIKRLSPQPPHQ